MLRRWLVGALALAVTAGSAVAQTDSTKAMKSGAAASPEAAKKPAGKATGMSQGEQVVMLETAQGTIVIQLKDADAPKTCANFRKLVKEGFYDGTYFHRVIPGFMIQGGDPNTKDADPNNDGLGGPGYTVPAEIKLKHERGSVATARTGDSVNPKRDSSGSQFFIDLAPQPSLDAGGYTVFGMVIQGMDAVDKIAALANDPTTLRGQMGPNPQKKALIKKATLVPLASVQKPAGGTTTTTTH